MPLHIAMIGQKGINVARNGGVETHVEELSTRLVKLGYRVTVFCRRHFYNFPADQKPPRNLRYRGVDLEFTPSIHTKYLDTITHTLTSNLRALRYKPDIYHFHGVGPSILSFLPRLFAKQSAVIVTFHSQDRYHTKWGPVAAKILEFGEYTATHFPDETIVVSKTLQKYCHTRFLKQTKYIPNGVATQPTKTTNHLEKFNLEPRQYLLAVARLVPHKGFHYLIEAFRQLPTPKKLVLVGDSPYPTDYTRYLSKLAAQDPRIIFAGYQKDPVLRQLYSHAYLYAHPSESEGLSVSILEAESYSLGVLASDIPENKEVLNDCGVTFVSKDVQDLKNKLAAILKRPARVRAAGRCGRQNVLDNYNWPDISEKTARLYQDIIERVRA